MVRKKDLRRTLKSRLAGGAHVGSGGISTVHSNSGPGVSSLCRFCRLSALFALAVLPPSGGCVLAFSAPSGAPAGACVLFVPGAPAGALFFWGPGAPSGACGISQQSQWCVLRFLKLVSSTTYPASKLSTVSRTFCELDGRFLEHGSCSATSYSARSATSHRSRRMRGAYTPRSASPTSPVPCSVLL